MYKYEALEMSDETESGEMNERVMNGVKEEADWTQVRLGKMSN